MFQRTTDRTGFSRLQAARLGIQKALPSLLITSAFPQIYLFRLLIHFLCLRSSLRLYFDLFLQLRYLPGIFRQIKRQLFLHLPSLQKSLCAPQDFRLLFQALFLRFQAGQLLPFFPLLPLCCFQLLKALAVPSLRALHLPEYLFCRLDPLTQFAEPLLRDVILFFRLLFLLRQPFFPLRQAGQDLLLLPLCRLYALCHPIGRLINLILGQNIIGISQISRQLRRLRHLPAISFTLRKLSLCLFKLSVRLHQIFRPNVRIPGFIPHHRCKLKLFLHLPPGLCAINAKRPQLLQKLPHICQNTLLYLLLQPGDLFRSLIRLRDSDPVHNSPAACFDNGDLFFLLPFAPL